jgi:hypothetical protein
MRIEYKNGTSVAELTRKYKISDRTVRKYLGGILRSKKRISKSDRKKICQEFASGKSVSNLIKEFLLSSTTIYRILHKGNKCEERKTGLLLEDIGKTYHWLTVLKDFIAYYKNKKQRLFECQCICGQIIVRNRNNVKQGGIKSCGCYAKISKGRPAPGKRSPLYKGHGEISGHRWSKIKEGAKVRDLEFSITVEYVWNLFLSQDRKCALSGIPIGFQDRSGSTASLDRIDNSKGYVIGNVQWVHKDVNIMKHTHSQDYFIGLCATIASHMFQNVGISLTILM